MKMTVSLSGRSYDVIIERGSLKKAGEYLDLDRKALIVTDDGVPEKYAKAVAEACAEPVTVTVPQGEGSKSLAVYEELLRKMLAAGFTRKDCVVAVGGGVVGDLAGFTAASYMRGVDFYNIPTTVLSQVDSSIGGKTAVNLDSIKNIVGAFYQPKRVLIDPDALSTLPRRQTVNGLAEALKVGVTSDAELFDIFENGDPIADIDTVIYRALDVKRKVVEQDEKESGLRRVLNFGHTLGHGIESEEDLNGLYHGECVALGMLPMCSAGLRARLEKILKKLGLPTTVGFSEEKALNAVIHDKKSFGGGINCIISRSPGSFEEIKLTADELRERLESIREAR